MRDIFYAVEEDKDLFKFHANPNEDCPVGRNIHKLLDKRFDNAKEVMLNELSKITLDQLKIELDKLIKKLSYICIQTKEKSLEEFTGNDAIMC